MDPVTGAVIIVALIIASPILLPIIAGIIYVAILAIVAIGGSIVVAVVAFGAWLYDLVSYRKIRKRWKRNQWKK